MFSIFNTVRRFCNLSCNQCFDENDNRLSECFLPCCHQTEKLDAAQPDLPATAPILSLVH